MNDRHDVSSNDWPERLGALPPLDPPARVWTAITAQRHARRKRWWYPVGFAVAASAVMVAALVTLDRPVATTGPADDAEFVELAARSADLGRLLHEVAPTNRALDLTTASTIVALEDRLAIVDAHLMRASLAPAEATVLWRQRVELMEALVGVHATSGHTVF